MSELSKKLKQKGLLRVPLILILEGTSLLGLGPYSVPKASTLFMGAKIKPNKPSRDFSESDIPTLEDIVQMTSKPFPKIYRSTKMGWLLPCFMKTEQ